MNQYREKRRRKETRKYRYITFFSVFMLCSSIALIIPVVIEGINVGKNVQVQNSYSVTISQDQYDAFHINIKDNDRIYLELFQNGINEEKAIIAIMEDYQFDQWYNDYQNNSTSPSIDNSEYYFERSNLYLNNVKLDYDDYYIVIYNANTSDVTYGLVITVIPFGHIIPLAILGVLLAFSILFLSIKLVCAFIFNLQRTKNNQKKENSQVKNEPVTDTRSTNERYQEQRTTSINSDDNFCTSCGAPLSTKDSRYCPQCGATIEY
jgi:large-conductance mechanosensitive channel